MEQNGDSCSRFIDTAQFDSLFLRKYHVAYSIALQITQDVPDAQDIVQVAFCRLWASRRTIRGRVDIWLAAVVRNAALDIVRTRSRGEITYSHKDDEGACHAASAEDEALLDMESLWIAAALESLCVTDRKLLQESFFERLSHSAIANRSKLPLGTVKSRIRSSLKKLRHLMQAA
jgi:RNA polymerase sigma-70 factor (ECF subfamily)